MKTYRYTAGYRTYTVQSNTKKEAIEKAKAMPRHLLHSVNVSSFRVVKEA